MGENVFTRLTDTASDAFLEALELLKGDEQKVKQMASAAVKRAVILYEQRHSSGSVSGEMTFEDFRKDLLLNWPFGNSGAIGEFRKFLYNGCTEQEAKRWLGQHIWEFDDDLREKLTLSFAADALHQAAKRPLAEPSVKPVKQEKQILSLAEYDRRSSEAHARGGFREQWDFMDKYTFHGGPGSKR